MASKEEIEKRIMYLILSIFTFVLITYLYQKEKWSINKQVIKEEIRDDDLIYIYEYKIFSFRDMRWKYRVSTPSSNPVRYYEWDKKTNELIKAEKY